MCNNSERNVDLNPKISTQNRSKHHTKHGEISPKNQKNSACTKRTTEKKKTKEANQRPPPAQKTEKNKTSKSLKSLEKTTIHPWKQAHGGTKATITLKTKGSHEHPERKARNLPLRAKQHSPEGLTSLS
jgi:phosphatidate phosphatase PAH1